MIMISSIPEFAIIADDLTGSLDTGLQFKKGGLLTIVPLKISRRPPGVQALVLNTDSRNLPGDQAYRRVYNACRRLKAKAIYKKIDSTMRGNVGQETLAILDAQKIPKAIIAPTIPGQGRTVEKGILRVHGVPLLRTPYAKDPFHPLWASRVPDLLQKEIGLPVGHLALGEVRKSPAYLAERIEQSPARILAVDAVRQSDLKSIASAWRLLSGRVLACGSVGLADELYWPSKKVERKTKSGFFRGPLLIISASRNPGTAEQIEEARKHLCLSLLEPDLLRLTNPRWGGSETGAISTELLRILSQAPGAILTTTFQKHFSGKERAIPTALGKVAAQLLRKARLGGLVLTGGDLAMGVCARLSASALRIEEEVLPGIPCSTLTDGPFKGLRLITKAGGFGAKDALWRIIQYLRGEHESQET
jgi:uncharacterized protein YgbK (DUF1537 family)